MCRSTDLLPDVMGADRLTTCDSYTLVIFFFFFTFVNFCDIIGGPRYILSLITHRHVVPNL